MPYRRRQPRGGYRYPNRNQRRRIARNRNYGTRGRGLMGLERKYFDWQDRDTLEADKSVTANGQGGLAGMYSGNTPQNPQGVSVGTGPTERIGRKIGISDIFIDITLNARWTDAVNATEMQPTRFKIFIILDKQTNGLSSIDQFLETPAALSSTYANAFRDLTNSRRYKVLKTIEGIFQPPNNTNLSANTGIFYNDQARKFQVNLKFKKPFTMIYNDTASGAFDWNQLPTYSFKPAIAVAGSSTGELPADYGYITWNVNGRTRFYDA